MFLNYDKRTEEHVRKAFRLPPMFIGRAEDYSFASAFVSYTVAEAQVFKPERDEFDEIINNTLMRELADGQLSFESLPVTTSSVETKLNALDKVKDRITRESLVATVNELTGMNLEAREEEEPVQTSAQVPGQVVPLPTQSGAQGQPQPQEVVGKASSESELLDVAQRFVEAVHLPRGEKRAQELLAVAERLRALPEAELKTVKTFAAMELFADPTRDLEGLGDLAGCAVTAGRPN